MPRPLVVTVAADCGENREWRRLHDIAGDFQHHVGILLDQFLERLCAFASEAIATPENIAHTNTICKISFIGIASTIDLTR